MFAVADEAGSMIPSAIAQQLREIFYKGIMCSTFVAQKQKVNVMLAVSFGPKVVDGVAFILYLTTQCRQRHLSHF